MSSRQWKDGEQIVIEASSDYGRWLLVESAPVSRATASEHWKVVVVGETRVRVDGAETAVVRGGKPPQILPTDTGTVAIAVPRPSSDPVIELHTPSTWGLVWRFVETERGADPLAAEEDCGFCPGPPHKLSCPTRGRVALPAVKEGGAFRVTTGRLSASEPTPGHIQAMGARARTIYERTGKVLNDVMGSSDPPLWRHVDPERYAVEFGYFRAVNVIGHRDSISAAEALALAVKCLDTPTRQETAAATEAAEQLFAAAPFTREQFERSRATSQAGGWPVGVLVDEPTPDIQRYRAPGQNLTNEGTGCRVTVGSEVASCHAHASYVDNLRTAMGQLGRDMRGVPRDLVQAAGEEPAGVPNDDDFRATVAHLVAVAGDVVHWLDKHAGLGGSAHHLSLERAVAEMRELLAEEGK